MRAVTEEMHEATIGELDQMISSAYDAKEQYLLKHYETVIVYLNDVAVARKRAEALINEMWE